MHIPPIHTFTPHQPRVYTRLAIITGIILAIVGILAWKGRLPSLKLSGNFITGGSIAVALAIGGALVVYRSRQKELSKGKVTGSEHWKETEVRWGATEKEEAGTAKAYIDLSFVDSEGNGVMQVSLKEPWTASLTGLGLAIIALPYGACVMIYHLLRLIIVPFYILVRLFQERGGPPTYLQERRFSFSDIPKQMAFSLAHILKAPFYATALIYAGLKAIIDPLNGVKEGSIIERDWNHEVPLYHQGIWMLNIGGIFMEEWKWEGGGGPESLGKNGFYAAGSWQPCWEILVIERQYRDWRLPRLPQSWPLPDPRAPLHTQLSLRISARSEGSCLGSP